LNAPIETIQPEVEQKEGGNQQELKREVIEFVKMIAWFLVVFFLVKAYVVEGYEVQGPSMDPTLQDRERILVLKLPHELSKFSLFSGIEALKQGDIVVFDSPVEANKRYIKRVIAKGKGKAEAKTVSAKQEGVPEAKPKDGVRVLFDRGAVYVNNKRLEENYLPSEARSGDERCEEEYLQPGAYYVLGDNRPVSKDSRSFGPIDDGRVIGKAMICFWPPSHIRLLR
jgi:signal peptidase I